MYKLSALILVLPVLFSCTTINEGTINKFESRCPEMTREERIAHSKLPYYRPPPYYPREAANNGIGGYVDFEFDISTTGKPINISVIESYPSDIFVKMALRSVRDYKYKIKTVNSQPMIDYCQSVRVSFQMER